MKKEKPLQMVSASKSPIDILFDKVEFKCTICDKPAGTCDCWVFCSCGWAFEKGEKCRNPDCAD